jgi:pimeloyl-ACP methyl ester carboxylesterase
LPLFNEKAVQSGVNPTERKPVIRWRFVLGLAFLYLVVITITNLLVQTVPLPDLLVLFPSTHRIDAGAAIRKPIPFQDGDLEIWTAKSKLAKERGEAQFHVLRFYGNADRADRWVADEAEMWNNRAAEVWGMNYPGFGGSTGPARLARLGPAALTAFDAVKQSAGDHPIIVFGASLGTTTALHIAAHRPVAGLILHNPPPIREMILRQFGWWNLWLLAGPLSRKVPAALDSIANARAIHVPAVFLLAEEDEVVAPRFQHLVVDAYAGEKRLISLAGANHNSPLEGTGLRQFYEALDWLLPKDLD